MSAPPPPVALNMPEYMDRLWSSPGACPFDDVIDVRSPGEFAEDHIPNAVNLPVLSDAERAEVGTIFCQQGAFPARKLGAAYVSVNIARHLRQHFAGKEKGYRPFVYCWRGGQRSASMATVLAQVGWRVSVLRGGYKTYRAYVRRELDSLATQFDFQIVAGPTGTGKTRLLHALSKRGAQIIDLEALAVHRGSVLGGMGPQPSQKLFDSQLLAAFGQLDPARPVWLEAESNRIGDVYLPEALWKRMQVANGVELNVPFEERIRHLLREYAGSLTDAEEIKVKLSRFPSRYGHKQVAAWNHDIERGAWEAVVASLLTIHYDPAYSASLLRYYPHISGAATLTDLSPESLDVLATQLHTAANRSPCLTSRL
jgi:tRNA 2-selenouridine synthase